MSCKKQIMAAADASLILIKYANEGGFRALQPPPPRNFLAVCAVFLNLSGRVAEKGSFPAPNLRPRQTGPRLVSEQSQLRENAE